MAQGTNYTGDVVLVNDQVSILGIATAISGIGVTAAVTVQTQLADTFTTQAGDMFAFQDDVGSSEAESTAGNDFQVNDQVTVNGVVTNITGKGQTAQLTVQLFFSGNSVVCSAGTVYSSGH
jgi:hypothetical protein